MSGRRSLQTGFGRNAKLNGGLPLIVVPLENYCSFQLSSLEQDMLANAYGASARSIFCTASATAFSFRGASVDREMSGRSARMG
jgi:hypothetical protein